MKSLMLAAAALFAVAAPALALDADADAILTHFKPGKTVPIADIATFMRGSAKWCYAEQDGTCGWTDVYLNVTDTSAQYEGGAAWDENTDIGMTHETELRDGRYICEIPETPASTTWAVSRADGSVIQGRDLATLKQSIADAYTGDTSYDCFDYAFLRVSPDRENIVVRQRQYIDGVTDKANDVEVTIHYDPAVAKALKLRF
ncbi:hypothetical protein [Devosia sp.]|uniref:hypothetical protein n=1 Tax=Devosia sp. TaxID=1871048 RepID=UPI003265B908